MFKKMYCKYAPEPRTIFDHNISGCLSRSQLLEVEVDREWLLVNNDGLKTLIGQIVTTWYHFCYDTSSISGEEEIKADE